MNVRTVVLALQSIERFPSELHGTNTRTAGAVTLSEIDLTLDDRWRKFATLTPSRTARDRDCMRRLMVLGEDTTIALLIFTVLMLDVVAVLVLAK